MDAFTQLLEPFLSPISSPLTDAIAFSGMEKIAQFFVKSCEDEAENPQVREGMAYAAFCSGIALSNAGLGIVHGFASPLGGLFPIPHGVICGTLMAIANKVTLQAMRIREPENLAIIKMAKIGQLLTKETDKSTDYYCDLLINTLEEWTEKLEISKLGNYGVTRDDFERIIAQTSNRNNPIKLTRDEMISILENRL
jgi:alcohol dehydrogenase